MCGAVPGRAVKIKINQGVDGMIPIAFSVARKTPRPVSLTAGSSASQIYSTMGLVVIEPIRETGRPRMEKPQLKN